MLEGRLAGRHDLLAGRPEGKLPLLGGEWISAIGQFKGQTKEEMMSSPQL